jgi:pimeloyl-ACP methyl ester carboxylesterase
MLTISMPTQVIWGMDDKALPPDLIEGLAEFVPHLTIHKIPGATHWILHEEPALVTQLLQQFLQSKPD